VPLGTFMGIKASLDDSGSDDNGLNDSETWWNNCLGDGQNLIVLNPKAVDVTVVLVEDEVDFGWVGGWMELYD
jgi:hypothetical protein